MTHRGDRAFSSADGGGLNKLEYFTSIAMQNLQNVLLRRANADLLASYKVEFKTNKSEEVIAKLAVKQAEALIYALNEGNKE